MGLSEKSGSPFFVLKKEERTAKNRVGGAETVPREEKYNGVCLAVVSYISKESYNNKNDQDIEKTSYTQNTIIDVGKNKITIDNIGFIV